MLRLFFYVPAYLGGSPVDWIRQSKIIELKPVAEKAALSHCHVFVLCHLKTVVCRNMIMYLCTRNGCGYLRWRVRDRAYISAARQLLCDSLQSELSSISVSSVFICRYRYCFRRRRRRRHVVVVACEISVKLRRPKCARAKPRCRSILINVCIPSCHFI